jgi:hypothetical protein
VLKFWRNPEFVRHLRAELRPARVITVAFVVFFLCALIGLACWAAQQEVLDNALRSAQQFDGKWTTYAERLQRDNARLTWLVLAKWLLGLQGGLLTFWSLFSCAQSVTGERDRKTWDFQRTTSLTPAELLIGKLLGEPVLGYFAAICVLPVALVAGFLGGLTVRSLAAAYLSILATALFLGLGGLWISTLLETRSRGVGLIGALVFYGFVLGTFGFATSWFPGIAAFSPLTGLHSIFEMRFDNGRDVTAALFGHEVPWLLMTLLLCGSFGAWFVLMLVRNLKRDYEDIRLLSRWQAVGCAAFLNFVFYALLRPTHAAGDVGSDINSRILATFMVCINGLILFAIGLATLTPHERLKIWWRQRAAGAAGLFSEDGLPWPWLALSALVAYGLMVWGLVAWRLSLDFHVRSLGMAAVQLLIVLVFITRDVLFIQWCTLTRLRQPIVKGVLFLSLYYGAAGVFTAIAATSSENAARIVMSLLTPIGVFDPSMEWPRVPASIYGGLAVQIGLIAVIIVMIANRLARPALTPVASGD